MVYDSWARWPALKMDERTRKIAWNGLGALIGLAASVAGYALWHEPLQIELEKLTIRLPNAQGRLPASGLRILHLTDTHFQGRAWREGNKIERIRRLTAGLEYDLLIHTGDFWHYESGLPNLLALLDAIPAPRLGSYAVFGNHDYVHYNTSSALPRMWRKFKRRQEIMFGGAGRALSKFNASDLWRFGNYVCNHPLDMAHMGINDVPKLAQSLVDRGFKLLHNQNFHLSHCPGQPDGVDIYLAGVDDVIEGQPRLHDALLTIPAAAPTILLSHNPDIIETPQIEQVDLVLAGHTHGGQVVLPLFGPAHTQSQHLSRDNVAGYLRRGRTHIYISRGIGEGIPIRFGAPPQIALITLRA